MFASVHSESRASRILECHADTFLFSGNGSRSSHHLRVALPLETRFLAGVLGGSARPAPERLLPVVRAASISRSSSSSRSLRMSGLVSLSTTYSVLFSRRSSWKRLFMGVHSLVMKDSYDARCSDQSLSRKCWKSCSSLKIFSTLGSASFFHAISAPPPPGNENPASPKQPIFKAFCDSGVAKLGCKGLKKGLSHLLVPPNGLGSFLKNHIFHPFLTHFWLQNNPFSRYFVTLEGPKWLAMGLKWAHFTCLGTPNGPG